MSEAIQSWGRLGPVPHAVCRPRSPEAAGREIANGGTVLAYGCGRSYGDVPLNPGGRLVDCRGLDRFIAFDRSTGVLTAEAGVRLADILAVLCRPDADGSGWMLPVSPGTRFITLGGALANDVHGKNHHRFGTFGAHVLSFELWRSDGTRHICSRQGNADLFAATIGGLGLTGLVGRVSVQLRRVPGTAVDAEDIRFDSLPDYFALTRDSDPEWEYTAAWIDSLARGRSLGRGILSRARHRPGQPAQPPGRSLKRSVPLTPPMSLVGPWSVRVFNTLYAHKLGPRRRRTQTGSYEGTLYPLDALGAWNRIYGPHGFYEFQCQLPHAGCSEAIAEILGIVASSRQSSMLSAIKMFGDVVSPGLLSFPAPGATVALDFPNRGAVTRALMARLEAVAVQAGGRLYPAKDALMSAETFRAGYPAAGRFQTMIDPAFASAFSRRVGLTP